MGKFFVVALLALAYSFVHADSNISRFVFITEPQTINYGELSGGLTIQAQDAGGNSQNTSETIDLEFSSTSTTGEFLSVTGEPVKPVMNTGTAKRTFYYRDKSSGSYILTVKATGRVSGKSWTASQDIIVVTGGSFSGEGTTSPVLPDPMVSPPAPSPSTLLTAPPNIRVYAGEDKKVLVGSNSEFAGNAIGLSGEPLDNARLFWNFGDGETQEGRLVSHIFKVPGKYTVGLHVSSGGYAASDYMIVEVLPNQIVIKEVLEGRDGFVRLVNKAAVDFDIGGWILEDSAGKRFILPSKTRIGANSEIAFSNLVTGLFWETRGSNLKIFYSNGAGALVYSGAVSIVTTAILSPFSEVTPPKKLTREMTLAPDVAVVPEAALEKNSSEPEGRQVTQTSISGSGIYFFFMLAAAISLAASLGFILVRRYAKT